MDNKQLIKLHLLTKKINEHFSKNPNAKSFVVEGIFGNEKTRWKIKRENKKLFISEGKKKVMLEFVPAQVTEQPPIYQPGMPMVPIAPNMAPSQPVMPPAAPVMPQVPQMPPAQQQPPMPQEPIAQPPEEAPPPQDQPVDPGAAQTSSEPWDPDGGAAFKQAVMDGGLRYALKALASTRPDIFQREFGADPQTQLNNPSLPPDIPAQTQPPEEGVLYETSPETISQLTQAIQSVGEMFAQLTNPMEKQQAAQMLQSLMQMVSPGGTMSTTTLAASKRKGGKIIKEFGEEPGSNVSDPVGLESDPVVEPKFQPQTAEEYVAVRDLKGQTIKDISLEKSDQSFRIKLELVTTEWPAIFEFTRDGKTVFTFKDRKYLLNKK